ncbi:TrbI/VirB10 family protein [Qipengyuania sp. DGS5-3]|uniref:TrbI/VirB10 family protein n=1 Tax=Qipengyuania sp. DGS5-3 TaxID=3349632 RepID=UPI0036D338A0
MVDRASDDPIPGDVRPIVATGSNSNLGLWAFLAILLLGCAWLFSALSASREAATSPRTSLPDSVNGGRIAAPPAPAMPARFLEPEAQLAGRGIGNAGRSAGAPVPRGAAPPPPPVTYTPPVQQFAPLPTTADPFAVRPSRPQVVFDRSASGVAQQSSARDDESSERISAGRLSNPAFTVPLGTIIPAVLETAFDSTQAGAARALVQRDIYSFDGSRVLIPRGSRLHGEYEGTLERGQNRALIQWTRLIRPDGVTMALDSPASDPLGKAGVRGKVDSKFFQRFGGAILQSVLDIGVGIATREATDGVIVALPGSTQNLTQIQPQDIRPTLKIKHGTSVSVYVARDLDFASVDR